MASFVVTLQKQKTHQNIYQKEKLIVYQEHNRGLFTLSTLKCKISAKKKRERGPPVLNVIEGLGPNSGSKRKYRAKTKDEMFQSLQKW